VLRAVVLAVATVAAPVGDGRADEALRARGELLFNIGGCTNCHTAKDGPALAGGEPIRTPFGTFHAPNITPDPETGIGGWSEADFIRAMQQGVSPSGAPYYPAFPYTSYTLMSADDLRALKAHLDTIPPARRNSPPHDLAFPYNLRLGLRPWRWLFFTPGRFVPDPSRDAAWNRGAFLVNGPGHCQECHTPRTRWGTLDAAQAFAGGDLGPGIGKVPNITAHPERGIGRWSEDDIAFALTIGATPDGQTLAGDMAKVVANGTSRLPEADLLAVAAYLASLPPR
jgi:mono/diheme cytochrome c family protein